MSYSVEDISNLLLLYADDIPYSEPLSNFKLNKLLYLCQGFFIAYFDEPLFEEDIEHWFYGPVVPVVYEKYKDYNRSPIPFNKENIKFIEFEDEEKQMMFDEIFRVYNKYSSAGLKETISNHNIIKQSEPGEGNIIKKEDIKKYFKKLLK